MRVKVSEMFVFAVLTTFFLVAPVHALTKKNDYFAGFKDCKSCPELAVIPSGTFIMGADSRYESEGPAHRVTIAKPFAMGIYEVTFDEWKACFKAHACGKVMPDDHGWGRGKRPVINITWYGARRYVRWLSKKTGKTYHLPSEAQWEYAARADAKSTYWWGNAVGKGRANCRDCGVKISRKSEPVDSFKPNPWGLYNVSGNVWEWVADCWNPTHIGAPADGAVRLSGDCRQRVIRGGSWYYFSKNMRSAWRFKNDARVKSYGIGFRVMRELP